MYPTLFELFGFPISSFGFMLGLAAIVGTQIASRRFEEAGYDGDMAWTLAIFGFIGVLLGSRLWFVAERIARAEGPIDVAPLLLSVQGGMTFYGGLVGTVLAVWIGARWVGFPFWSVLNLSPVAAMVAQGIGRIGCFLVGDDYGRPTDLPWGVAFPEGRPPTFETVHPTMLYESAWLFLGAWVLHRRRHRSLSPLAEYFIWTGIGRAAVEILRLNPPLLGPLSNAQVVALSGLIGGIAFLLWLRYRSPMPFTAPQPASGGSSAAAVRLADGTRA